MIRTALWQTAKYASRVASRSQMPAPRTIAPCFSACHISQCSGRVSQGARWYSAPAGLAKQEVEGRIIDLLKGFDKVCRPCHSVYRLEAYKICAGQGQFKGTYIQYIELNTKILKHSWLQVAGTSHFSNDLGLDSLDTVEVVMAIEEVNTPSHIYHRPIC